MKKRRLILPALLSLCAIVPAAIGLYAEHKIRQFLPDYSAAPEAAISLSDYHRGWLQSRAVVHLHLPHLQKDLELNIYHTPFYNSGTNLLLASSNNDTAVQGTIALTPRLTLTANLQLPWQTAALGAPQLQLSLTAPADGSAYPLTLNLHAASLTLNTQPSAVLHNLNLNAELTAAERRIALTADCLSSGAADYNGIQLNSTIAPKDGSYALKQTLTAALNDPALPDYKTAVLNAELSPINPDQLTSPTQLAIQIANNRLILNAQLTTKNSQNQPQLTADLHLEEHIDSPLQLVRLQTLEQLLPYLSGSRLTLTTPERTDTYSIEHSRLYQNGIPYTPAPTQL